MITRISYWRPDVVYWLHTKFPKLRLPIAVDDVVKSASVEVKLEFLKWLWWRKRKFTIEHSSSAQTSAASQGDMATLSWLYEHRIGEYRMCTLEGAAANGHFEIVKWLFDRRHDKINIFTSPEVIVENGHFEIFNWLFERLDSFGTTQMEERRQKWAHHGMKAAAYQGQLDTVKLIHEATNERLTLRDLLTVSLRGHLNVSKWAIQHQTHLHVTDGMMDSAAEGGHLAMVKFIRSKGKTGIAKAMDKAAVNGHFEVLKWLHKNRKGRCTYDAMDGAVFANRPNIVQWLHANRSEGCTTDAMDTAVRNGWMEMVQWLHDNRTEGCTTRAMDAAAAANRLDIVQWLHENRAEGCTTKSMDTAIRNGWMEMVQWLHAHRSEGCTQDAIDYAVGKGDLQMVEWFSYESIHGFLRARNH